jgi:CRISPR/Cas system-associated endonuclease Cas3-HD
MVKIPTQQELMKTLLEAAKAHHEYQSNFLGGVRHEQWASWYSAYVLGRLGDFTSPTFLTGWLEEVSEEKSWFKKAAEHVHHRLEAD